jgi:hypothetical protein
MVMGDPDGRDGNDAALAMALRFHDAYERLAPSCGYETRADTRVFDPTSPNGRLMIAVCAEIIAGDACGASSVNV